MSKSRASHLEAKFGRTGEDVEDGVKHNLQIGADEVLSFCNSPDHRVRRPQKNGEEGEAVVGVADLVRASRGSATTLDDQAVQLFRRRT